MNDTEKLSLIAPIVHAARRAWRFVHATGKLLPEWGECTAEQRNETYEAVREVLSHSAMVRRDPSPEKLYAWSVAAESFRSLFPVGKVTVVPVAEVDVQPGLSISEWAAANAAPPITMNVGGAEVEPSTLQPPPAHPRRGRR
jgi:hypothetical protein